MPITKKEIRESKPETERDIQRRKKAEFKKRKNRGFK